MWIGSCLCFLFIIIVPQDLPEPLLPDVLKAAVALPAQFGLDDGDGAPYTVPSTLWRHQPLPASR